MRWIVDSEMIDQLAVARVRKETDNVKVTPVDLLHSIIADIQDGLINPDGLIVLAVTRPDDSGWETESYRCGMKRTDEIAFLELAKETTIRKWRNS